MNERQKKEENGEVGRGQVVLDAVNHGKECGLFPGAMIGLVQGNGIRSAFLRDHIALCSKLIIRRGCCNSPGEIWW